MNKTLKRMVLIALVSILMLSILPESVLAADIVASGICGAEGDNLTWTLDSAGLLTISGNGAMADYVPGGSPWYEKLASVASVVLKSGVTSIGSYAFFSCTSLTRVTVPKSVTSISDCAFSCCSSQLTESLRNSVKFIDGVAYYYYCDASSCVLIPIPSINADGTISIEYRSLTDVYFQGTQAEWAGISIGSENESLTYAKVHFNARTISATAPVLTGAAASAGQITVKWNAVSGAKKYAVYRKVSDGSWERLSNTVTGASYTDKSADLKDGTSYYYTVRAYVGGAWGGYDPDGIGARAAAAASSAVPVLSSAAASAGQIAVEWNAVSGATKYAVYRKVSGGGWKRLTNSVSGTSYTDKSSDLKAGTTYYYTVKAYVNGKWSGYDTAGVSAAAGDTKPTITTQPKNVTVAAGSTAKFTVKADGSNLTYQWQYSTNGGKTWKNSPATGNKTATLKISATASKSGYKYRCIIKSGTAKVTSKAVTLTVTG